MKNKKVVILLLVLAAGIWGTVIYRIFKTVRHTDKVQAGAPVTRSENFSSLSDTFSITADYRDPFLGKRTILQTPKKPASVVVKPKPAPVMTVVKWPAVSYSGTIRNHEMTKELAMIKIDQRDFIMKPGDINLGVELSKIFTDSIIVLYQKEKKVITK